MYEFVIPGRIWFHCDHTALLISSSEWETQVKLLNIIYIKSSKIIIYIKSSKTSGIFIFISPYHFFSIVQNIFEIILKFVSFITKVQV